MTIEQTNKNQCCAVTNGSNNKKKKNLSNKKIT